MYPIFEFFGREIPAYGLMAVVGYLLALALIGIFAPSLGLDRENAIYIFTLGVVGALIGAKVFYLIQVFPELIRDLHLITEDFTTFRLMYINGGMVFYGGLIGGILMAFYWAKAFRVDLREYLPILLPGLAIFAGCGRLGCFFAGCCYGRETDGPIAVVFSRSLYAPNGVPLVPTQLIEAAGQFLFALALLVVGRKEKLRPHLLAIYLTAYCLFRFVLEFWRGDAARGSLWGLSTSQWVSILILLILAVSSCRRGKKCI